MPLRTPLLFKLVLVNYKQINIYSSKKNPVGNKYFVISARVCTSKYSMHARTHAFHNTFEPESRGIQSSAVIENP